MVVAINRGPQLAEWARPHRATSRWLLQAQDNYYSADAPEQVNSPGSSDLFACAGHYLSSWCTNPAQSLNYHFLCTGLELEQSNWRFSFGKMVKYRKYIEKKQSPTSLLYRYFPR